MNAQVYQLGHDGLIDWNRDSGYFTDVANEKYEERPAGSIGDMAEYQISLMDDNGEIIDVYYSDSHPYA